MRGNQESKLEESGYSPQELERMKKLVEKQGFSPEEAKEFIDNWETYLRQLDNPGLMGPKLFQKMREYSAREKGTTQ